MTAPAPVLVIEHESADPVGRLGLLWARRGLGVDIRRGWAGDPIPVRVDPERHSGLVVLGGYMGADDDAEHGWLAATKQLLRAAVSEHTPTLGVCLGHQLLCSALGGRVGRNPSGRALGLVQVGWLPERRGDPLLGSLGAISALHYNDDIALDLPPGARLLARSADGAAQAVRFGERAWGVQFHPEVEVETFVAWGEVPEDIATAAYAADASLHHLAEVIAGRFADLLER